MHTMSLLQLAQRLPIPVTQRVMREHKGPELASPKLINNEQVAC